MKMKKLNKVILFERFNIDWLIRQVSGNGLPVFEGKNREKTLTILNDLRKQGYTTLRSTPGGVMVD